MGSCPGLWRLPGVLGFTHSSWGGFCTPGKRARFPSWFCISGELGDLPSPQSTPEEAAGDLQSHMITLQTEAQREVGVGALQMHVVAGIIPMNLGRMVDGNEELSAQKQNKTKNQKTSVGWSWRRGMAARMALKVGPGKVGGWSEAGRRGGLGFVPSKHC